MKWKKFLFTVLFILSVLSVSIITSRPVNALVIQNGSALNFTSGTAHNQSDNTNINATKSNSDLIFNIPAGDKTIDRIVFNFSTSSGTSANFLFTFNARFQGTSAQSGFEILDGILGGNMDVFTLDCVNVNNNPSYNGSNVVTNQGNQTTTCSYLVFSHGNYTQFQSHESSRIVRFYSQVAESSKIILTPGTLRHIAFDGLTASDREWLVANMPDGVSQVEIDEIESKIQAVSNKLDTVNGSINNLRSDTQAQTQEIQQGNEEAQDRWEADKAEEAEREEQGQDDADEARGVFNFTFANPFEALLNMFRADNCVSITTIASMLHSEQTTYCSWWSSTVRSILTPVFSIASVMLLFGFVVRWISSTSGIGGDPGNLNHVSKSKYIGK